MKAMANNKSLITLAAAIVFYLVSDFFFNDALLYIVGGTVALPVKALGGNKTGDILPIVFWVVVLLGAIVLFFKAKNKAVAFIAAVIIACLLYIIDLIAYDLIPQITTANTKNITIVLLAAIKSCALALILNVGRRYKNRAANEPQ